MASTIFDVSSAVSSVGKAPIARRTLRRLLCLAAGIPLALYVLLAYSPIATSAAVFPADMADAAKVLVVVAHPDDEALFFAPTLTTLRSRGAETHLLVLSTGNYYGKGRRRYRELSGSCSALGVALRHCINIDKVDLRDGPRDYWPLHSVQASVRSMVVRHNISLVVSFDERGISGHLNHRATSAAVSDLAVSDASFPPTYLLRTVHYWRFGGYSLLEIVPAAVPFAWRWLSGASHDQALLVSTVPNYLRGRRAFGAHRSQGGWDSWIWRRVVSLSRNADPPQVTLHVREPLATRAARGRSSASPSGWPTVAYGWPRSTHSDPGRPGTHRAVTTSAARSLGQSAARPDDTPAAQRASVRSVGVQLQNLDLDDGMYISFGPYTST